MHLGKLYQKFDARCKSYDVRLNYILSEKRNISPWQFNYLTEVLVSDIWQSWNLFCRELVMASCRGTTARNRAPILARVGDNSWQKIGYEASQFAGNRSISSNGHVNFLRWKEPTWGSLDKFITIVNGLNPANKSTLVSIYGSFNSINDLQKLRNACAHKNVETIHGLYSLSAKYKFTKLNSAVDLAWSRLNRSSELAIELWLYEMNLIADLATSST